MLAHEPRKKPLDSDDNPYHVMLGLRLGGPRVVIAVTGAVLWDYVSTDMSLILDRGSLS